MIATDTYPDLDQAHIDAVFHAAQRAVADALALVAQPGADLPLKRFLPRQHQSHYDAEFARKLAATMSTVAWKLTEPHHVYSLASVAEQMALKYIVELAAAGATDDGQLDEFAEVLLEDEAFEGLWEQALDGAQGQNLAFADWFEPFSEVEQVHPLLQPDSEAFGQLWSAPAAIEDDLEDPTTEVFIALGEDWLDVPDNVADQIPGVIDDTTAALFPDRAAGRKLSAADREQVYESAAEDVRVLLHTARGDTDTAYDVWIISTGARRRTRYRLYSGLPLEEALTMRKLERMGDYRGVTDVEVRVYPETHAFDPAVLEVSAPPRVAG